jgi:hypothetical protein
MGYVWYSRGPAERGTLNRYADEYTKGTLCVDALQPMCMPTQRAPKQTNTRTHAQARTQAHIAGCCSHWSADVDADSCADVPVRARGTLAVLLGIRRYLGGYGERTRYSAGTPAVLKGTMGYYGSG